MEWSVAIGVDTHKHGHLAVACDLLGRQLDGLQIPACGHSRGERLAG
jgi:hypothetical protein